MTKHDDPSKGNKSILLQWENVYIFYHGVTFRFTLDKSFSVDIINNNYAFSQITKFSIHLAI